ncbi:2-oxoglutarate and iron dependent oxygenase [Aureococcus anophagefferens]|uniref:2-oxoglutarate and iron dependent oxygenase n=1 Tax=Aureococcus anophagefferens TaxID=44056 RepID=A0ABR1G2Y2_AURAN
MLCRRLGVKDAFLFATEAGAPAWLTLGFEHVGSSASLIHLRFDLLFKRDRGVLAPPARPGRRAYRSCSMDRAQDLQRLRGPLPHGPPSRSASRSTARSRSCASPRRPRTPRGEAEAERRRRPGRAATCRSATCSRRRRRRAPRRPGAAGGAVAVGARGRRRRRPAGGRRAGAAEAAEPLEAAPPAPAPRRCAAASKKRVVDDADADDEDEAWEPGRPSMMDLDDDEQEQAAKAKRKLKRRSKKKSAKAKNAAGAAPHAPEQERNAFLERIQAEEVRREQARIAAARPVPPPPNRATGAGRRQRRGFEESDNDDPVEDLIHRERIRERDLLRTPGCLALGRKAFRLEDMPRVTERDREILRRVLYILREAERRLQRLFPNHDFRLSWSVRFNVVVQTIDAIALDSNLELTRVDMEVRRSTVGVYEDSLACQLLGQTYYVHPDKTIKITVDLVVTSEVIGAFPRTAPGRAEVQIKELGFHFVDPLAPIAEKEIVPRVRVFIPYLGIEGWISITSRGPALDDGHLIVELKYLQAMHVKNRMLKKCCYTLYLVELADRLRAEASRETLKTARKNVVEAEGDYQLALSNYRQQELCSTWSCSRAPTPRVIRKFANAIARKAAEARGETFVPTPYDETAVDAVVVTAVPPVAPVATLVADGAKKVVFKYQNGKAKAGANGTDYLVSLYLTAVLRPAPFGPRRASLDRDAARRSTSTTWRRSRAASSDCPAPGVFRERARSRVSLQGRVLLVGACYRVIRDAKRRVANNSKPRARTTSAPACHGVDYKSVEGKLVCKFTVHEGTKTLAMKSAPADRRRSSVEILFETHRNPRPVARFEPYFGGNSAATS